MPPRNGCPADNMPATRSMTGAWLVALTVLLVIAAGFVGV